VSGQYIGQIEFASFTRQTFRRETARGSYEGLVSVLEGILRLGLNLRQGCSRASLLDRMFALPHIGMCSFLHGGTFFKCLKILSWVTRH